MSAKVHQISVRIGSGYNLISKDDYQKIPVVQKVKLITENRVHFLDDSGNEIPKLEALKSLAS